MNAMLWVGLVLLVVMCVGFLALWVVDARRANEEATDPERLDQDGDSSPGPGE